MLSARISALYLISYMKLTRCYFRKLTNHYVFVMLNIA
nr:MAG TPA: hypothetical protein [Caudoviricetes sp.]